jgi:hypothetical protein
MCRSTAARCNGLGQPGPPKRRASRSRSGSARAGRRLP